MRTIFALSSARGRAGIAIIRVSGPQTLTALKEIAGKKVKPREATLVSLRADDKSVIDKGIVLWFPGPKSATGEDLAEFHIHGGRAVISAVEMRLSSIRDIVPAEPGEFSRRAFENGKLDLTQVEGLADLIEAETEGQRKQAFNQLDGKLGKMLDDWREESIHALAYIEASIDFPEEEIPQTIINDTKLKISTLIKKIDQVLHNSIRGELMRNGVSVALVGAPNVGKSSLLNRIAQRDVVIVSEFPGTTRDIVEVNLDLSGIPIILSDTAGLRDGIEIVEQEGIKRAEAIIKKSDITVAIFDAEAWPDLDQRTEKIIDDKTIIIVNKADLLKDLPSTKNVDGRRIIFLSALTGDGIEDLLSELEKRVIDRTNHSEIPLLTRSRHVIALTTAKEHLQSFLNIDGSFELELYAEDLRLAVREIGKITGRIEVEELLDVVFKDFCIGK